MNRYQRAWLLLWVGTCVFTGVVVGLAFIWPPLVALPVIGFIVWFYFYLGKDD